MDNSKLPWLKHIETKIHKATAIFWQCRTAFGKSSPKTIFLIYSAVVRPMFSFAVVVWWPRLKFNKTNLEMNKIQILQLLATGRAMRTTVTLDVQFLINIPPQHLFVEKIACVLYKLVE